MPVAIKFCGLTRRADVEAACAIGAAYAGLIFAGGPRAQTVDSARALLEGGTAARAVGVFRADAGEEIARAVGALPLAVVQLHGDATAAQIAAAREAGAGEVWGVARIANDALPHGIETLFREADAVVLDTATASGLGGTGRRFDWGRVGAALDGMPRRARLVLAGGLRPENVAEATRVLQPDVVDVSSGVESSPGIKDVELMRRFADAAWSV